MGDRRCFGADDGGNPSGVQPPALVPSEQGEPKDGIIAGLDESRRASAYRPEIDGLRALAVLAVVVFHAFPGVLPGGFVGVDVFFVISGFLITGIIQRSVDDRTFSLVEFYARRLRRILPALLVVLVACLAAGYAFWLADEWRALGRHTFAGALFHANVALAGEPRGGYFQALSQTTPLLHLWSLGVEEQFYLAWPLLFAAWVRWTRWPLTGVLVLLAASFVLNLLWLPESPADAYFLPFTRLWELLVGGALTRLRMPLDRRLADGAAIAGLVLIAAACLVIHDARPFPGWWAWLPTLGTALVIAAGDRAVVNRVVLAARPLSLALAAAGLRPRDLDRRAPVAVGLVDRCRLGRAGGVDAASHRTATAAWPRRSGAGRDACGPLPCRLRGHSRGVVVRHRRLAEPADANRPDCASVVGGQRPLAVSVWVELRTDRRFHRRRRKCGTRSRRAVPW
jgi:peptidoglycan/LPS O-acetylase OafA/YrhL